MRIRLKTYLGAALLLAASSVAFTAAAAPKGWEQVKTERADAKAVVRETDIEIKAASGLIIVNANRSRFSQSLADWSTARHYPPAARSSSCRPTACILSRSAT